ncbi:hypothetical protein CP533_4807 [Ophiocordyceps camponoti-saundersi (nom. inval.)]|nr:hypothetical protein CP533_4807 [Ophiocordyceps camponoti-saundersi (nom. inval.)]
MAVIKSISLSLAAVLLNSSVFVNAEKARVRPIGKDVTIQGNKVSWISDGFKDSFECDSPKILCLSDDKTRAACCEEKNSLKGSVDTDFYCCADGHDMVGSKEVGYSCCPIGQQYDGKVCKLVCSNGKVLVDGKCACPEGQDEAADGSCKPASTCSSGLKTGKCYMFKGETGRRLAYRNKQYSETMPHKDAIPGKFQLCRDEKCTPNLSINPNDELHIRDIHGTPPDGADAKQWLNNAGGGNHLGKTPKYADSGNFTITKWPCGKYCLSGLVTGLGPACPSEDPSITFYRTLTEACVEYELLEVPCNIRDKANNCIWKNSKSQCCGKTECTAPDEGDPEPSPQPSPSSSPSSSSSTSASPPSATKPPKGQICPDKHGSTLEANGIGFRILCGWYYAAKDKLKEEKSVKDPLSCHAKCALDKKCQGANFDFSNFYCSHQIDWAAEMKDGGNVTGCVTFHPTKPRPI